MKPKLLAAASVLAAVVTGIVMVAGMAIAATISPTTPYPNVAINPDVCKAEKIKVDQAQLIYNQAVADLDRVLRLYNSGTGSIQEVRTAQKARDDAAIALNTAKYAQATCQNNAANPADKNCINLALELNRLIDELVITQDLEAIAKGQYDDATVLFNKGVLGAEEYQRIKTAYEVAKLQTQLIQQLITDQRAKTTAAGCKNVDRPAPSPTPSSPAPSSPSPTGPTPTTSPTPSPTTSTTPTGPTPSPTDWPTESPAPTVTPTATSTS